MKWKSFKLGVAPKWDSCACCSTKENLKTLIIQYWGGKSGYEVTLCKDCIQKLKTVLESEEI